MGVATYSVVLGCILVREAKQVGSSLSSVVEGGSLVHTQWFILSIVIDLFFTISTTFFYFFLYLLFFYIFLLSKL